MSSENTTDDLVHQLAHRRSATRRSAAKKLRKLGTDAPGPPVLEALQKEVQDPRTWETQYQMIMALADSQYKPAHAFLKAVDRQRPEPMVSLAIGDALMRLSDDREQQLLEILSSGEPFLTEGALRSAVMLHLEFSPPTIERILKLAGEPGNEALAFWTAAAAAGWPHELCNNFLQECTQSNRAETRKAARAAMKGKYLRWHPL